MISMRLVFAVHLLFVLNIVCGHWLQLLNPLRLFHSDQKEEIQTNLVEARAAVVARGIQNLGNTCYMNSVLQSMFHVPCIRKSVLLGEFSKQSVGEMLRIVFQDLSKSKSESSVNTLEFARKLNVNVAIQEDAQEFFLKLISALDDSSKTAELQNRPSSCLKGELEHVISCTEIPFVKSRRERFFDVSVDVSDLKNLHESFMKLFEKHELVGPNKYKAGEHGLQNAEMSVRFASLPEVLCVHLKRFSYDMNTDGMTKIGDRLEFPFSLDMSRYFTRSSTVSLPPSPLQQGESFVGVSQTPIGLVETVNEGCSEIDSCVPDRSDNDADTDTAVSLQTSTYVSTLTPESDLRDLSYELTSIVIHDGTADFGHYICLARPDPFEKPDLWIHLDDRTVTEISAADVEEIAYGGGLYRMPGTRGFVSKNAYMMFYSRKGAGDSS